MSVEIIFLDALEALKWMSIIASIATIFWLSKHAQLRLIAQGLWLGVFIGTILTLSRVVGTVDLSVSMSTPRFYPQLFLTVCSLSVVFVWMKRQLEQKLSTHAYYQK